MAIRQNEIWMPSIPLKSGIFSDAGYRFRENKFLMKDNWLPGHKSNLELFFDVLFYNSETLSVTTDYMTVAELYFRLDIDNVVHTRHVFTFMDWLGAIGGIEKILLRFFIMIYGGYANFNASIESINLLYDENLQNEAPVLDKNTIVLLNTLNLEQKRDPYINPTTC